MTLGCVIELRKPQTAFGQSIQVRRFDLTTITIQKKLNAVNRDDRQVTSPSTNMSSTRTSAPDLPAMIIRGAAQGVRSVARWRVSMRDVPQ